MTRDDNRPRKNRILQHADHPRPVTRRDFLSTGLISGVGMVALPSLASLFSPRRAEAQLACSITTGSGMMPFVCFDLAGGANIAGSNVMIGGQGGQQDFISADGYRKLGLPSDMLPALQGQIDESLGIAFHSDSAMLAGILDKVTPATLPGVTGSIICARSDNDTSENPLNPLYGIANAGLSGDLVGLVGTESSESGGRSIAPPDMVDPTLRPTKVDQPSDARGLVDTGRLTALLGQADASRVMSAVEELSAHKLDAVNEADLVKQLLLCGYVKTTDQVTRFGSPADLDPELDLIISGAVDSIFAAGELNDSRFRKTATVMKLAVNGLSGPACIELGGYDYHDGTRVTGEDKDFEAGQCIGAILEYAQRIGNPVMIYVFSDGSVGSDGQIDGQNGKPVWRGDNSSTAANLMLVYNPLGARPGLRTPLSNQIGYFRSSGDVETDANRIANDVNLMTQSVVLNYLALHGQEGMLDSVLPGHGLGSGSERDELIAFDQLV